MMFRFFLKHTSFSHEPVVSFLLCLLDHTIVKMYIVNGLLKCGSKVLHFFFYLQRIWYCAFYYKNVRPISTVDIFQPTFIWTHYPYYNNLHKNQFFYNKMGKYIIFFSILSSILVKYLYFFFKSSSSVLISKKFGWSETKWMPLLSCLCEIGKLWWHTE